MGNSRWRDSEYSAYSSSVAMLSRDNLFCRRDTNDAVKSGQILNATEIPFRESRDSAANPCACPLMVALDVTGSMGFIAERMAKDSLGVMVSQILQRKPVEDPHILFMGIGDAVAHDRVPLQATQFESDNTICDQLTDLILEGGGGGNNFESYDLAWAFAAYRTKTDQWEKRKQKGYLFTVGDECFPETTSIQYLKSVLKNYCPQAPTPQSLLADAQVRYDVFHIIVAEGNYASKHLDRVVGSWKQHLQKRAVILTDYKHISEVIVSMIAVNEGAEPEEIISSWTEEQGKTVHEALFGLSQNA